MTWSSSEERIRSHKLIPVMATTEINTAIRYAECASKITEREPRTVCSFGRPLYPNGLLHTVSPLEFTEGCVEFSYSSLRKYATLFFS
jgi:hypothetical protein